jgi:peroxiredoxin
MTRTAFVCTLLFCAPALAGKYNKVLSVGDAAPAWQNLDGTDGKKHSLADLRDKDVVVVVFTCNSCPVASGYELRLIAFAEMLSVPPAKAALVAINVNTGKEDQLPAMKQRAMRKHFPFAYLYDPTQQIAKKYGANYTPEFFVLNKDRKVVYMGSMDDKSPPASPTNNYLTQAVQAALRGKQPATTETIARGCRIRWNRSRDE